MTWWNVTPDVSAVSSQNFTAIFLHSALRCFESIETSVASRYRSAHLIRANASWDCYQKAISPLCIANNTLSFSVSAGDHLVKCRLEGLTIDFAVTLFPLPCKCRPNKYQMPCLKPKKCPSTKYWIQILIDRNVS